jgi:hypothetical protein
VESGHVEVRPEEANLTKAQARRGTHSGARQGKRRKASALIARLAPVPTLPSSPRNAFMPSKHYRSAIGRSAPISSPG